MKIGELSHRIFSFIKAKFSSIATLRFKILTKIKDKNTWIKIRVSYWMEYNFDPCLFPFIFVKILNRSTAMLFANAEGGLIAMSRCPALIKEKIIWLNSPILFTVIACFFNGVHECFAFDSLLSSIFLRCSRIFDFILDGV